MEDSLKDHLEAYKAQLQIGHIQKAYKGLMNYMAALRNHFLNEYPDDFVSGGHLYQGQMDVSFFTFTPISLKKQKLKVAIVFNHQGFRFEIWLTGQNRQIQQKYWEIFKGSDWDKYHIPDTTAEGFSIVDHILVEDPDFSDLNVLTQHIETAAIQFMNEIVDVLTI